MPTYEYQCPTCGVFDYVQKISENALEKCPTCGAGVERLLSAAPFHLKGSGWYKTDYASGSKKDTAAPKSDVKSDAKATDTGKADTAKTEAPKSEVKASPSAGASSGSSDSKD